MFYSAGELLGLQGEDNSGPKTQLLDIELQKQPRVLCSVSQGLINASGGHSVHTTYQNSSLRFPDPAQGCASAVLIF